MGQYQTRSAKSSEEPEEVGLREAREKREVREGEPTPIPELVIGSPIDTGTFLTSPGSSISGSIPKTPPSHIEPSVGKEQEGVKGVLKIPMVFRWDSGGREIYICGTFNNWETKIPLTNSHGDFTAIVDLPEGEYEYKFFVDGQWLHDPNEEARDNGLGSYNNVVHVTKKDFDAYYETWGLAAPEKGRSSPEGSYSQLKPPRSVTSSMTPHLPPLLQQTVLNQEPPSQEDPTLLSEPNHVTLNHLYALSIKDNVLVLAASRRYREKYVTTLMYKPVQLH